MHSRLESKPFAFLLMSKEFDAIHICRRFFSGKELPPEEHIGMFEIRFSQYLLSLVIYYYYYYVIK